MNVQKAPAMLALIRILTLAILTVVLVIIAVANLHASPARRAPDAASSREAFLQVYKVFTSPRCQNCHPSGDSPLQGDDSHPHLQNVKRGKDGRGVYGMRCDACHQASNLTGEHFPPGNPRWSLPSPEQKLVFVGRTPAELCRQLKDPKQTGGRSLAQLLEHLSTDSLVSWGWNPGDGRAQPPLSRADAVAQMKLWIDGGAACPE
jgi:hypothetical protein